MFKVKICGITRTEDALLAAQAGADAIGLNFYLQSSRFVTIPAAIEISAAVQGRALRIGVTVNLSLTELRQIYHEANLDALQLHGDEPPEMIAALSPIRVIKVFRFRDSLSPIQDYLSKCQQCGRLPDAVLLDAFHPEQYGGTGLPISFADLACGEMARSFFGLPWVLAGGLNAENVAAAIGLAGPSGVDVASGVESSPGIKDAAKVQAFVAAARSSLNSQS